MPQPYKKLVLLILDGFGVASHSRGNAISLANPQNLNVLLANYPALTLQASGPLVGLPWGEMGNSEVGHLNIGAGRIVSQDLPRITASIQSGDFFRNPVFLKACDHVKKNNSKLHLLGMVSPGGVHSYDEHLYALLGLAAEQQVKNVFIHMITDGRDTEPKIALNTLEKLHNRVNQIGVGKTATIAGRFYAMDRGGHWQQTLMMYDAMVLGQGETATSAIDAVAANYSQGIYDEMIKPTVIMENGKPVAKVEKGDAVIFFNFRQDRALQLTIAFVAPERMQSEIKPEKIPDLLFVTMTSYMPQLPVEVAFAPLEIQNDLAGLISKAGMKQFHAAESEKFAHVTSFFNGGRMDPLPGEERMIVSSPDNANNYVDRPEMSVERLADALIDKLTRSDSSFYVVNFANADMVGHTGNLQAAITAVRSIDEQIGKISATVLSLGGCFIITADHGNSEQMYNPVTGEIDKDHSTSPVPFVLIANEFKRRFPAKLNYDSLAAMMPAGALSDIAPTVLELFGMQKPEQMTGISLLPELKEQLG
ncbi:2,3-bisphosphoglycerate-independent phosphoglycerate mutase [Patescibacteria group bacterium]|nr:2,3-bisphosphoglycerate-independent phosphoglycerate mutase [Patescibacteria group bacterium]